MLSISSIKGDSAYYSHEDNYYASGSLSLAGWEMARRNWA